MFPRIDMVRVSVVAAAVTMYAQLTALATELIKRAPEPPRLKPAQRALDDSPPDPATMSPRPADSSESETVKPTFEAFWQRIDVT